MDGLRLANEIYKVMARVRKEHEIGPAMAEELLRLHFGDPSYVSDRTRLRYANSLLKLNTRGKLFIKDLKIELAGMLRRLESEKYSHLQK